jgi:hypothetical protein
MARQPQSSPIGNSKFITFAGFEKMNTKVSRQNLPETQVAWAENLQPIAPNDWVAVPAPNSPITTVSGKTCAAEFQINMNAIDYVMFFATDGSLTAVNANSGAQTAVAPAGTFSNTPDLTVFSSNRVLILDQTSGYATWDGTLFVKQGGLSPNIHITGAGSGYTSAPAVSFTGGAGGNAGGATATATISGGFVTGITLTNPGTGNVAGSAITVVLTGGGFSVAATATVVVWPAITGTTLTVGFGRVWYGSQFGRVLGFTGTGATTGQTWDDVLAADAAGTTTISDPDLSHGIFGLRFLNNFLFIFGDTSIKQIGSVTVQSSITLFTILTLASDIGTTFIYTILSYNRLVLFANKNGVYGIFGASVQKISLDLDGIFTNADFSLQMSSSLHDLHVFNQSGSPGGSIHCYMLLIKYFDPRLGFARSIICTYQNDRWFVVSVGNNVLFICGNALASTEQFETFVSSGSDVTQILENAAAAVPILLITSLSFHGNPVMAKDVLRTGIAVTEQSSQQITVSVDTEYTVNTYTFFLSQPMVWLNSFGQVIVWQNNALQNVVFQTGGFFVLDQDTEGYGKFIGNTVKGTVQGFSLNMIVNEYVDADPWGKIP